MTELLISVRNPSEALTALEGGADWIDVKEPDNGALGKASNETLVAVANALPLNTKLSAALGEAGEFKIENNLSSALQGYKLAKIGISNTSKSTIHQSISNVLMSPGIKQERLAIAAYADFCRASSINPLDLPYICKNEDISYLLIDTYLKDGSGLLDWISLTLLFELKKECAANNINLALAGSLKPKDIPYLLVLGPNLIGLRGSVCVNGARKNRVENHLVEQWAKSIK